MLILEKTTACADETEIVGAELAEYVVDNSIEFVALFGDLGAGKTAFVRGFASVIAPEAPVCSPTYAIVNEYDGKIPLFHFDMYRIEDEDALDSIGFWDYFGRGIIITEWSENIPYALPEAYLRVEIKKCGETTRKIIAEVIS